MLAALFGRKEVVHILIANGGKVNARYHGGLDAATPAEQQGKPGTREHSLAPDQVYRKHRREFRLASIAIETHANGKFLSAAEEFVVDFLTREPNGLDLITCARRLQYHRRLCGRLLVLGCHHFHG
jgi:hypothetical protein